MSSIEWLAGLLEGEGSFLTKSGGYSAKISCQMTDQDVIMKIKEHFGGSVYEGSTPAKEHYKPTWIWNISGKSAIILMKQLLPHMGERRTKKIRLVIQIWEDRALAVSRAKDGRIAAAKDYLTSGDSLRIVAARHMVSYESVRRAVQHMEP